MLHCRSLKPGEARHWYFASSPPEVPDGPEAGFSEMSERDGSLLEDFDAATRRRIHAGPYRSHLEHLISIGGAFGIFHQSECLALIAAQPLGSGATWQLWECLVHAKFRRQGLGARLVERLCRELSARQVEAVVCFVSRHHDVACDFLRSQRFALVGFDDDPDGTLFFRRNL